MIPMTGGVPAMGGMASAGGGSTLSMLEKFRMLDPQRQRLIASMAGNAMQNVGASATGTTAPQSGGGNVGSILQSLAARGGY